MENINDFQHTSFEVRSKGLKGFQSRYTILLSKKFSIITMGSKMSWNFISTIFKFYMSEKNIEFIQDPQKSIHYIGHEIVIYFFSNKLQITMAGAKKIVKSSGTKRVG